MLRSGPLVNEESSLGGSELHLNVVIQAELLPQSFGNRDLASLSDIRMVSPSELLLHHFIF